jgi:23S rRNA pseudouridine2605 synthase
MAKERLQKILAHAGVASRRQAEAMIAGGRVRVNGRIASELGTKADPRKDKIEVDGKRITREEAVYYVLHKPRGVVSTLKDPQGRKTIRDLVAGIPERVFPVGRLDYHTSGALLLTNDGELAEALLKPKRNVPKTYIVKMQGHLEIAELDALRNGVVLDDGYKTKPAELFVVRQEERHTWLQITLTEGKNRQIHRMGDAIGHPVRRLARVSFAELDTDGLRPGKYRPLRAKELTRLKKRYLKEA